MLNGRRGGGSLETVTPGQVTVLIIGLTHLFL